MAVTSGLLRVTLSSTTMEVKSDDDNIAVDASVVRVIAELLNGDSGIIDGGGGGDGDGSSSIFFDGGNGEDDAKVTVLSALTISTVLQLSTTESIVI